VPVLSGDLLPPVDFGQREPSGPSGVLLPVGWRAGARGVQVGDFAIRPGTHSFQLIGIANYLQAPPVTVQPGLPYCFGGQAIVDTASSTRLRVIFRWLDQQGQLLAEDVSGWQPVDLWRQDGPGNHWSPIAASFRAPDRAGSLVVRVQPASDDRVYLDDLHLRQAGDAPARGSDPGATLPLPYAPTIAPWPNGYSAALSFSFDWETAMGGLIHSRSVDDPHADQDPVARGLRMREGVTQTLQLFRPYSIRATYYANGYNFLLGNRERRQFMGNPTFTWADSQDPHTWLSDTWRTTPWFAKDPYGTAQSDPAWYFGDMIPLLLRERQDIQTHTFSHLYGGFASPAEWRADLQAWRTVAAERGVPMARSLAFPWSGSGGMSYANWDELEAAGITSVTRTKPNQPQYQLASADDPHCRPIPGHERILACPDFYLTAQRAAQATRLIDHTIAVSGTIDLWAHTEEVTSPAQVAAWGEVVSYAARLRDEGKLWIAPLAEIADWQAARAELRIENVELRNQPDASMLFFKLTNSSSRDLNGVTMMLPFTPKRITVDGTILNSQSLRGHPILNLDLRAGQTVEVAAWPA
jgi:hypothetical protein